MASDDLENCCCCCCSAFCSAFGCNTPIGLIYSINPAMIIALVPVVGALTTGKRAFACRRAGLPCLPSCQPPECVSSYWLCPLINASHRLHAGFSHFDVIHIGGYISALSPLWMVAFDRGTLVQQPSGVVLRNKGSLLVDPVALQDLTMLPESALRFSSPSHLMQCGVALCLWRRFLSARPSGPPGGTITACRSRQTGERESLLRCPRLRSSSPCCRRVRRESGGNW